MMTQLIPESVKQLWAKLDDYAVQKGLDYGRIQREFSFAVVCQMLPHASVVKGGASLALQFPVRTTRFTSDLDIIHQQSINDFKSTFSANLSLGWFGFTGDLVERGNPPKNDHMPLGHQMTPLNVKLYYLGKSFSTVKMDITPEISHEIELSHYVPEPSNKDVFIHLGFPAPKVGNTISFEQQLAQKVHGLSNPDVARPEDLVDIQLILSHEEALDKKLFASSLIREFEVKKRTTPLDIGSITAVNKSEYALIKDQFPDLLDFDEALAMVEELTTPIFEAKGAKAKKMGG